MSGDKKDKKIPQFNGSLGAVMTIHTIIMSVADLNVNDDSYELSYLFLLESWYCEIIPLVLEKAKDEVVKEEKLSFEERILKEIKLAKGDITANEVISLEKQRNLLKNNPSITSLRIYHKMLMLLTNKVGLRVKLVNVNGDLESWT